MVARLVKHQHLSDASRTIHQVTQGTLYFLRLNEARDCISAQIKRCCQPAHDSGEVGMERFLRTQRAAQHKPKLDQLNIAHTCLQSTAIWVGGEMPPAQSPRRWLGVSHHTNLPCLLPAKCAERKRYDSKHSISLLLEQLLVRFGAAVSAMRLPRAAR